MKYVEQMHQDWQDKRLNNPTVLCHCLLGNYADTSRKPLEELSQNSSQILDYGSIIPMKKFSEIYIEAQYCSDKGPHALHKIKLVLYTYQVAYTPDIWSFLDR